MGPRNMDWYSLNFISSSKHLMKYWKLKNLEKKRMCYLIQLKLKNLRSMEKVYYHYWEYFRQCLEKFYALEPYGFNLEVWQITIISFKDQLFFSTFIYFHLDHNLIINLHN